MSLGNSIDIDAKPNQANQELHAYSCCRSTPRSSRSSRTCTPPGVRMCLEAIWGDHIQMLNCVGYDHNWVKQYVYADDAAPLLPKGTIVHLIGFLDTTPANRNPVDPRNWSGDGRRSIANMFSDLGYCGVAHRRAISGRDGQAATEHEEQERLRHRMSAVLGAAGAAAAADHGGQQGNQ